MSQFAQLTPSFQVVAQEVIGLAEVTDLRARGGMETEVHPQSSLGVKRKACCLH